MFRSKPQAFLALPRGLPETDELEGIIRETLSSFGVVPWSIADVDAAENVALSVHEALRESDFVIADITGNNVNVIYEVGVAVGMGKELLLVARRSDEIPEPPRLSRRLGGVSLDLVV